MAISPIILEDAQTLQKDLIIPRITARIFIENADQYLYLLQLDERGGQLSLPGGRIKNKESIQKGLIREVKEETNIILSKKELIPIHTLYRRESKEVEVVFFFKATISDLSMLALNEPEKFKAFEWLPKEVLSKKIIAEFRAVLKSLKKGKLFSEFPKKKKRKKALFKNKIKNIVIPPQ